MTHSSFSDQLPASLQNIDAEHHDIPSASAKDTEAEGKDLGKKVEKDAKDVELKGSGVSLQVLAPLYSVTEVLEGSPLLAHTSPYPK